MQNGTWFFLKKTNDTVIQKEHIDNGPDGNIADAELNLREQNPWIRCLNLREDNSSL